MRKCLFECVNMHCRKLQTDDVKDAGLRFFYLLFWDNNVHIQHLLISKWSCRFILSALCSPHTDSDEGGVVLLTDWCHSSDEKRLTEAVLTSGVLSQPFTSACSLPEMTELTSGCGDKMVYKTLQRPNCCFCMFTHLFYTSPINVTNPTFSLINAFFPCLPV